MCDEPNTLARSKQQCPDEDKLPMMPPLDEENDYYPLLAPQMPLKKRAPQANHYSSRPHPRKRAQHVVKQQIKDRMTTKYSPNKNYGHVQRVKFALFLKVLMKHLSMTDEKLHAKAQMVRYSMYSDDVPTLVDLICCSRRLSIFYPSIDYYRWYANAPEVNERGSYKVRH